MMKKLFSVLPLALLPLGFLLVMAVAPLFALLDYEGGLLWEVLADDFILRRLWWTVAQAALTCAAVLPLGVLCGWVLARLEFAGRTWILRLLMLPFVMPTLVAAMGVLALFGANGLIVRGGQDTPYLLLYGNVFFNLPVLVRAAYQGFAGIPAARLAAAQTLGAGAWQRFRYLELPSVRNWLAGGLCLVFLYCFSGFGLALLLGGTDYSTIEVEIYRLITVELDTAQAGVLVWVSLGITALAGALYAHLSRTASARGKICPQRPSEIQTVRQKLLVMAALGILAACCVLPLAAITVQAVRAGSSWLVLSDEETRLALYNTLRFTAAALAAALLLGISHAALARQWAWIRGITFLPFMVSPVCVAFGVLLLYPEWTASLPLLIATYALLAYPFVTKDVLAAWDALPPNFAAAARSLGASPLQTAYRITLPLLLPALQRGLTLAAATCIGEFAATLFLSRPEWQTLTTLVYRYLGTAGADNYDRAMVLTAVLSLLALAVFLLLDAKEKKAHHV